MLKKQEENKLMKKDQLKILFKILLIRNKLIFKNFYLK